MSIPGATPWEKRLGRLLKPMAKDLEGLLGVATSFEFGGNGPCCEGGTVYRIRIPLGEGGAFHAGFFIGLAGAADIAAKLLMMPESPSEMDEELEECFGEAVNLVVGAWRREVVQDELRPDNSPGAREAGNARGAVCDDWQDGPGIAALHVDCTVDGTVWPCTFFEEWTPSEEEVAAHKAAQNGTAPAAAVADSGPEPRVGGTQAMDRFQGGGGTGTQPMEPGTGAGPGMTPTHLPGMVPAGAGAAGATAPAGSVMFIDASGALTQWLADAVANRIVTCVHGDANMTSLHQASAVLVIEPNNELFRALNFAQQIVLHAPQPPASS